MADRRPVRSRVRPGADMERRQARFPAGSLAVARPDDGRRAAGDRPAERLQSVALVDDSPADSPRPDRDLQRARQRDDRAARSAPGGGNQDRQADARDAAASPTVGRDRLA